MEKGQTLRNPQKLYVPCHLPDERKGNVLEKKIGPRLQSPDGDRAKILLNRENPGLKEQSPVERMWKELLPSTERPPEKSGQFLSPPAPRPDARGPVTRCARPARLERKAQISETQSVALHTPVEKGHERLLRT